MITHINRTTKAADGEMFTDFLFLAIAVKNKSGEYKYIVRNDSSPAGTVDWQIYLNNLFAPQKNLNALYTVSKYNGLGRQISTDVWIGLPYPHPNIFAADSDRVLAVTRWINSFLKTWNSVNYSSRLTLRGFYYVQESLYYNTVKFDDANLMVRVNKYIHSKHVNNRQLKSLWIPYQKAAGWDRWKDYGFDLSVLQPSYYFNPKMKLETGACDAHMNVQGVEMELDLACVSDGMKRSRFIEYMDKGCTGGSDSTGRLFGAYMKESPLAWYLGGWYWNNGKRNHCIHNLYRSGDILYDKISEYLKGTYKPGNLQA